MEKTVTVRYFALLREQAGRPQETRTTRAGSAHQLYEELSAEYPFTLSRENIRVAVNDTLCHWDRDLCDKDRIVFLPPVAGG